MTSAEFSPAPFAVPNAVAPGTTLPDLEYTLYQPQQLKSRVPALMIHGFATRGEQLYGGTSWIRQYLRAGYPVLIVTLPYHSDEYLKDPESMHAIDCKLPNNTSVRSRTIPFDSVPPVDAVPSVDAAGRPLTPMHLFTTMLAQLLRTVATENDLGVELEPRAHVIGFSFGARVGWELALTHPEAVASLTLGGLPLHDHLITLRAMLEAHEGTSVTADSETPAADSTDEAIASFTSIIDGSPIQPDALLKFVRIPFGPFFDVPALRAGSPDLPAGHPGAHPHAPIAVVLGDADTIAADGAELYDMVRGNNPLNRFISLAGRDHVNALTSGAFRRGALAFAAEVEAAE
ncbi:alpha/beta hydrolase [Rothia sp. HMSC066H02]|uniref:alpha/beta hydrolase n=1 Tax=unclassified Rothia (in: high G+C Gram-positive bacteria) TaxID=2689056 RepID=UPI0008A57247|nr:MULTISPECIES: alpha/beta hydrolase [unclassified Rothia (in: high G+C Gram-positive bacteria)]OFO96569.1 alpha/beta hydrolase [Rothia sp. HMSC065D09]OFP13747.1 alpha/beta hydrolase [Rothia sp. HMSC066H02]